MIDVNHIENLEKEIQSLILFGKMPPVQSLEEIIMILEIIKKESQKGGTKIEA